MVSSVERQIGITQQEHIAASILAIKLSAGITHLVVDIPVGPKSRIKNTNEAMRLRKLIEYVGDMLSIEIDAVITDGSEPIGNGVGAVLEARDVMKVLRNKDDAPQDLREKSLFLAGRMLEFDPKLRGGQGYHVAKEILNSGRALEVMNRIIHAQGKAPQPQLGHLTRDIVSNVSGVVEAIDNARINKIGIWAGAGQYPGAGLDLMKKSETLSNRAKLCIGFIPVILRILPLPIRLLTVIPVMRFPAAEVINGQTQNSGCRLQNMGKSMWPSCAGILPTGLKLPAFSIHLPNLRHALPLN